MPAKNPQGGFVPESIVCLPGDVLVGARRGKPFSCSGDLGQTWTVIEGAGTGLYQPCIRLLPDGRAAAFGHCGADSAVGADAHGDRRRSVPAGRCASRGV